MAIVSARAAEALAIVYLRPRERARGSEFSIFFSVCCIHSGGTALRPPETWLRVRAGLPAGAGIARAAHRIADRMAMRVA
jgi:hypothetical protein